MVVALSSLTLGTLPSGHWAVLGKNCYVDGVAIHAELLASGAGWSVSDVVCSSGPRDRRFEEEHGSVCIAAVMQGSFQYRTTQGVATMVPGAVLLGNHGSCFECGHDHSTGDRCLSFLFEPAYFEGIVASVAGARRSGFSVPRLPPMASLTRIFADAEVARSGNDRIWLEQVGLELAAAATRLVNAGTQRDPPERDLRRVAAVLRRIERDAALPLGLGELAREADMSPYHFLRTFRRVVGMTPHQYILRTRLQDAMVRLRRVSDPVLEVALDAGFADLSTFNRRFRTVVGMTPSDYRSSSVSSGASEPPRDSLSGPTLRF
jgi:AraC family transcriptional regulator